MSDTTKEASRCTGHCCRCFVLPCGPAELEAEKARVKDGEQIAAMVIYLGQHEVGWSPEAPILDPAPEGHHYYTCKNFDVTTNNCRAYETRPAMCRDYPYGNPCRYQGCTRTLEPPPSDAFLLCGIASR